MGGLDAADDGGTAEILELAPGERVSMRWADGVVSSWELDGSLGRSRLTLDRARAAGFA